MAGSERPDGAIPGDGSLRSGSAAYANYSAYANYAYYTNYPNYFSGETGGEAHTRGGKIRWHP